jgi:hypothetical protein
MRGNNLASRSLGVFVFRYQSYHYYFGYREAKIIFEYFTKLREYKDELRFSLKVDVKTQFFTNFLHPSQTHTLIAIAHHNCKFCGFETMQFA